MITAVAAVIAIGSALVQALDDGKVTTGNPWPPGTTTTGSPPTGSPPTGSSGGKPITDDAPDITPSAQGFGEVDINPGSKTQVVDFTVTNPNGQAIGLDSTDIPGGTGFSRTGGTCAGQLAAHAFCTVSVEFSPSRIGPASTELTVTSGTNITTAKLTGSGFVELTVVFVGGAGHTVTVVDVVKGQTVCKKVKTSDKPEDCESFRVFAENLKLKASIEDPEPTATSTSTASPEYVFKGWLGACNDDNSDENFCKPPSDQNTEVTATFGPPRSVVE